MKKILYFAATILLLFGALINYAQDLKAKDISIWEGKVNTGALALRIVVKFNQNEDGTFAGTMDSPDQGTKDIPLNDIEMTNDSLTFKLNAANAAYAGKIEPDKSSINGTWTQRGAAFDLKLSKVEKVTEVKRPQTPQQPFPYTIQDISFKNNSANIELGGTVTSPSAEGKYPAVVLVTGSGAQDRDETLFEHKPFWVIADYLTRHGIVVLRYDDRGVGKSTGIFSSSTSIDFATDAISGVEYLKTRKDVDVKKIGIIGHSEGGLIAPMAAQSSSDVSFIVLLAGPGVKGSDLLLTQVKDIMKVNGTPEDELEKNIYESKTIYDLIINNPDSLTAFNKLHEFYNEELAKLSDEEKKKPENSKESFDRNVSTLLSPWFRFFLRYDPQPALENTTIPVLALNGDKDLQVSSKVNLPAIESALKTAGNKNYKTVELPGLNHLFQHTKTGAVSEYGTIEESFSPEALKIMGDWILGVTGNM